MKITLSEHCTFELTMSDEIVGAQFLNSTDFLIVKVNDRRKVFSSVFPFLITHNRDKNNYNLQADYYVGLDWLVEGKKFIQVEPKINQKLLEIYQQSIDKEFDSLTDENQEDELHKKEFNATTQDNLSQINYLKMLLEVYSSNISSKEIGNLIEIYWDSPKIKIQQKEDYLTPFLVVQFLTILKTIVRKGLKKSYYKVQENLNNRIKGKILIGQNIKQNILKNRLTSTYCEYQVFGTDSLENQFLKKVFQFCTSYVEYHSKFFLDTKTNIGQLINYIRPAFQNISDLQQNLQVKNYKNNPFFNEYKDAIQIGNYILKQFSYNISSTTETEIETPPFWIDMPRLFELYVYSKLLKSDINNKHKIKYQFATYGNYLDFLIKDGNNSIVVDTKYKLHYQHSQIHKDIRQVSGYARLKRVRNECGIYDDSNINCLIIYPTLMNNENDIIDFSLKEIQSHLNDKNEIKAYHKVYKLGIHLPYL